MTHCPSHSNENSVSAVTIYLLSDRGTGRESIWMVISDILSKYQTWAYGGLPSIQFKDKYFHRQPQIDVNRLLRWDDDMWRLTSPHGPTLFRFQLSSMWHNGQAKFALDKKSNDQYVLCISWHMYGAAPSKYLIWTCAPQLQSKLFTSHASLWIAIGPDYTKIAVICTLDKSWMKYVEPCFLPHEQSRLYNYWL